MRSHRVLFIIATALLGVLPLYSQTDKVTKAIVPLPPALRDAVKLAATNKNKADAIPQLADVLGNYQDGFFDYLRATSKSSRDAAFEATYREFLKKLADGRVDQQGGGSTSAGAASGAASRAGITDFITGALESGAMTQSLDNNVLTLRANGEGLFRFLSGQDVLPTCLSATANTCKPSPGNNLELSVSLDVSESNTVKATGTNPLNGAQLSALLTAEKRQVTAATARYAIINSRNLRSDTYREAWKDWYVKSLPQLRPAATALLQAQSSLYNPVERDGYQEWRTETVKQLQPAMDKGQGELERVFQLRLEALRELMVAKVPDLETKIGVASAAAAQYYSLNNQGFALGNVPMLTAELTYSQPPLQPKLISGKVVFAWSPKSTGSVNPGTVTFNGAVERYTSPQPDSTSGTTSVWRDAQVALQFDRSLGGTQAPTVFTLGAYFQYQMAPGIIDIPSGSTAPGTNIPLPANAKQLLAPKGNIGVLHAGLTLQLPNSGVKIPIGVSWSNRTELLTGNEIRGHIGFTFDTHSLLLLAPKP